VSYCLTAVLSMIMHTVKHSRIVSPLSCLYHAHSVLAVCLRHTKTRCAWSNTRQCVRDTKTRCAWSNTRQCVRDTKTCLYHAHSVLLSLAVLHGVHDETQDSVCVIQGLVFITHTVSYCPCITHTLSCAVSCTQCNIVLGLFCKRAL